MKSLLETGEALPGSEPESRWRRRASNRLGRGGRGGASPPPGITANNSTWELLDGRQLSADEVDDVLGRAYAAMYHWQRAARRGPETRGEGSWLVSRVHAVLGHGDLALHHADRCRQVVEDAELGDFDLAYAHESRALALACLGRLDEAAVELKAAHAVPIADPEDKAILDADLASDPWYGLTP